jgi:hypothetical protein
MLILQLKQVPAVLDDWISSFQSLIPEWGALKQIKAFEPTQTFAFATPSN